MFIWPNSCSVGFGPYVVMPFVAYYLYIKPKSKLSPYFSSCSSLLNVLGYFDFPQKWSLTPFTVLFLFAIF